MNNTKKIMSIIGVVILLIIFIACLMSDSFVYKFYPTVPMFPIWLR